MAPKKRVFWGFSENTHSATRRAKSGIREFRISGFPDAPKMRILAFREFGQNSGFPESRKIPDFGDPDPG
jgi:hypothetical protein